MSARSAILVAFLALGVSVRSAEPSVQHLTYAPAPVDNPLKGLVPYAGDTGRWFPHSMEFRYLPLSGLVTGENRYNWQPLEKLLMAVAGRGNQTIFRVFLEYPGKPTAVPEYLIERGVKIHPWGDPGQPIFTPDYEDPELRRCLQQFIAALGERYDGDSRIAFITAGLLGQWGEWHTHPRNDLWASKQVQREVMDAYETAFSRTPILYRYPAGPADPTRTENASRPVGYHDDSFAWATLDTEREDDQWFFMVLMKKAGQGALSKWKSRPIGGEIRPEAWGKVFDPVPARPHIQDFARCVEQTHVSWLMDTGMFAASTRTAPRHSRAEDLVRRMGYEFHVSQVTWQVNAVRLEVEISLENRGVAPFYYDWPVEFALLQGDRPVRRYAGTGSVRGVQPGDARRVWNESFDLTGIPPGTYPLVLRTPNPMAGGKPLRFANQTQSAGPEAWLTLCVISHTTGDTPPAPRSR